MYEKKAPKSAFVYYEQALFFLYFGILFVINSFGLDLLPYKAVGSGILQALAAYPDIQFFNDTEGEQFTAVIGRPAV